MPQARRKHKRVKHYHEPGDFHELIFSCYRGMPLLTNDRWRSMLARVIDRAMNRWEFRLAGFVLMPEHVHLLVFPLADTPRIDALLKAVKQPVAFRIGRQLQQAGSPLLERLTVRERPGVHVFRFWQEGPGYDRNLQTAQSVLASLDYLHQNPVVRGLCQEVVDWKWSSARFYASEGQMIDAELPTIHPIPGELFSTG